MVGRNNIYAAPGLGNFQVVAQRRTTADPRGARYVFARAESSGEYCRESYLGRGSQRRRSTNDTHELGDTVLPISLALVYRVVDKELCYSNSNR